MSRVRLGIIGCGGMSRHHGHVFTKSVPEAEIVALVDPNEANLARYMHEVFGESDNKPKTFSDHRAMLESTELDGVVIVSPHSEHFQQAMDAMDAGAHVLVEKPMVIAT